MAGFLQQISDLLNPDVKNNTPLVGGAVGTTQTLVEKVVFRGMFTIMFMGVTYVGIKMLTKGSSAPSVIQTVTRQQSMSNERERTSAGREAEAGRSARATQVDQQKDKERAEPTVRRSESTVTHRTETTPAPTPPSKTGPTASDIAGIAAKAMA
jgi:hypothetical protein